MGIGKECNVGQGSGAVGKQALMWQMMAEYELSSGKGADGDKAQKMAAMAEHLAKGKGSGKGMSGKVMCKFYALGQCNKGEACPFVHEVDDIPTLEGVSKNEQVQMQWAAEVAHQMS